MTSPNLPLASDDGARLLAAYDAQLREESEVGASPRWDRDGPLVRAVFDDGEDGGFGFVTYRALTGYDGPADGDALDALIARTVEHYAAMPDVNGFEWKTRGHDAPSDLGDRLVAHGLVAEELETVMVGEAALLAVDVVLPPGVSLRRVGLTPDGSWQDEDEVLADVSRALAMQAEVFGSGGHQSAAALTRRILDQPELAELWVAEATDGRDESVVVSAGRLDVVPGTQFAGIWGGSTLAPWRGQGIYRALTAARARSALAKGVRYIHSDCSPDSRPILARAGLLAITTTTPYVWRR